MATIAALIIPTRAVTVALACGVFAVGVAAGCAGPAATKKAAPAAAAKVATAPAAAAPVAVNGASVALESAPSSPVFFDFDSDIIRSESRPVLQQMAKFLMQRGTTQLTVEGHCDDLGAAEYNLALGDRRARAVTAYLVKLGVPEARLRVLSYGEEKPAVANTDDTAREQNRRGAFDLKDAAPGASAPTSG